jgi:hypothetical protein
MAASVQARRRSTLATDPAENAAGAETIEPTRR